MTLSTWTDPRYADVPMVKQQSYKASEEKNPSEVRVFVTAGVS